MSILDLGPRTKTTHPEAKESPWGKDYGPRGFVERDRPYFDDLPPDRQGADTRSRWGSRPVRDLGRPFERDRAQVPGLFRRACAWIRNASRRDG